jgi:glucose-fructose oxidoreductase
MPTRKKATRKIRYAVIGQGYFAQMAVLPAFAHAKNVALAALVSDDRAKLEKLGEDYGVETLISYDQLDQFLDGGEIDAVYLTLPNSLHREYTLRAARAGVHVLCEKPLGVSVEDCEAMIRACEESGVKLMTAYRLHFEEANLKAAAMAHDGTLGDVRAISSVFTMNVQKGNIRLDRDKGGGPLWDIGTYCINAARTIFRAEPTHAFAVGASRADERFAEVHEQVAAVMRFPDERLASFTISFGATDVSAYELVGTKGSLRVDPAFDFAHDLAHTLRIDGKEKRKVFRKRDQVAPELSYFADCILHDREPEPSGHEGLADVRVIQALYESTKTGHPVELGPLEKTRWPDLRQERSAPLGEEPELFHAEQP